MKNDAKLFSLEKIKLVAQDMVDLEQDSEALKRWKRKTPKPFATDWPRDVDFTKVIGKYCHLDNFDEDALVRFSILVDYYIFIQNFICNTGCKLLMSLDEFFQLFMETQTSYIEQLNMEWGLGLWKKGLDEDDPGRVLFDGFCDVNYELKFVVLG